MLSARMILPVLVVACGSWSLMVTAPLVPGAGTGLERQERELACAEQLIEPPASAERRCAASLTGPVLMPVRW